MPLTDNQRTLAADNHQLIYGFMQYHHLSIDQYEGVCEEGLCKAAMTFNPAKGTFSTWAYFYMLAQVRMEMRYEHKQLPTQQLEPWMNTGEDRDYHGPGVREVVESLSENLKPRDQKVLRLLLTGRPQSTIALEIGCSQPYISRIKARLRKTLKEMMVG